MQTIAQYSEYLESEISRLNFPITPENLYDPLRYFMTLGGKRMRPMLAIMGAELFGAPGKKAIHVALAVEIFHNFTLIHDDIMDEAPLRRKQQTVHSKWDNNVAILSGDVLLIKAYQEICKQDASILPALMNSFNTTAIEVCEGQQMDMDFETKENVRIEDYIEMIRLKTSVLLGCALEMGAIVAETSIENRKLIYEFGQQIGVAFQIQDDILDLYADAAKFGKQIGGDIISNKKTYLLLKAYETADTSQKAQLIALQQEQNPELKIKATKSLFEALGIREAAKKKMDEHYAIALRALNYINVPEVQKTTLKDLAAYLLVREV